MDSRTLGWTAGHKERQPDGHSEVGSSIKKEVIRGAENMSEEWRGKGKWSIIEILQFVNIFYICFYQNSKFDSIIVRLRRVYINFTKDDYTQI